jgi:hypothetical protein
MWDQYCDDPLHQQVLVVRRVLYLVCRMQYCLDVLGFEGYVSHAMMHVENTVPCVAFSQKGDGKVHAAHFYFGFE